MILAIIQSVREYLVQHVAISDYDPGLCSVCERVPCATGSHDILATSQYVREYLVHKVAITVYDPGHYSF